jgi:glycosyltransferase involved in cell wall biosynthesis
MAHYPLQHSSPIKVLFIIDSLPLGGAENQIVTLATALRNDRYSIHVCCLRSEGVQADTLKKRGISVVHLGMRLRYWPIAVYKLYRLITKLKPSIVHTHLYQAGIWGRLAAKLAGVPIILSTEHSNVFPSHRIKFLEQFANHFTDKTIVVSETIRQWLIQSQGILPENIIFIPNAVDVEQFNVLKSRDQFNIQLARDTTTIIIGTVARLVKAKRLDYLLEAAKLVWAEAPQARFLIIGDGPLHEELEEMAKRLDLTQCVRFLGNRRDIPELLAGLDLFILSSEREGIPVAMLEAMAASIPVVATCVGGIPQVIQNGKNGVLVPPHDPLALANAIIALCKNSSAREAIGGEGYRTVLAYYSIRVVANQIASLYDSLLRRKSER